MIKFVRNLKHIDSEPNLDGYVFCRTTGEVDTTELYKTYYNTYVERGYAPEITIEEFCEAARAITNSCNGMSFVALKNGEAVAFVNFARNFTNLDNSLEMFEFGALSTEYVDALNVLVEYAAFAIQQTVSEVSTECLDTDAECIDFLTKHSFTRV